MPAVQVGENLLKAPHVLSFIHFFQESCGKSLFLFQSWKELPPGVMQSVLPFALPNATILIKNITTFSFELTAKENSRIVDFLS